MPRPRLDLVVNNVRPGKTFPLPAIVSRKEDEELLARRIPGERDLSYLRRLAPKALAELRVPEVAQARPNCQMVAEVLKRHTDSNAFSVEGVFWNAMAGHLRLGSFHTDFTLFAYLEGVQQELSCAAAHETTGDYHLGGVRAFLQALGSTPS